LGAGFVGILSVELHFPEAGSLKGKRKYVKSAKAQLQNRFGASVAEVDHHDLWQRATLHAVLVGRDAGPLHAAADKLERHVLGRFPDGVRLERALVSSDEFVGD
jgi:uncharacterized protein YlxP (DUF503 family)